jgi:hypothetical protein
MLHLQLAHSRAPTHSTSPSINQLAPAIVAIPLLEFVNAVQLTHKAPNLNRILALNSQLLLDANVLMLQLMLHHGCTDATALTPKITKTRPPTTSPDQIANAPMYLQI